MKKAAILAAPGFEEIELMAPLDILRRLNFDVLLAGVQSDKVVSTHEVTVSTDTMLDKLHADKLDALVLPGGAGVWVLRDTPEVIHLVKKMHAAGGRHLRRPHRSGESRPGEGQERHGLPGPGRLPGTQ